MRPLTTLRPLAFGALATLFSEPQHLTKDNNADDDAGFTMIDYEEQTAGYQASYSRLAASEAVSVDPVAHVRDPQTYLGQQLLQLQKAQPSVKTLLTQNPQAVPFAESLSAAGYIVG